MKWDVNWLGLLSLRKHQAPSLVVFFVASPLLIYSQSVPAAEKPSVWASPSTRLGFEVASIKLNSSCRQGGPHVRPAPGRLSLSCVSLRSLISTAYGRFANGAIRWVRPDVLGGPAWVDSELYDIEAKAVGPSSYEEINGVMLQALLQERFKVEVRSEFREMSVYLLTVAKGGPKLVATKSGVCVPEDPYGGPPRMGRGQPYNCGRVREISNSNGSVMDGYDLSMSDIAGEILAKYLDRPIIDRTGLTGKFDVHLSSLPAFVPRGLVSLNGGEVVMPSPPTDDRSPSVFTFAEEQLGLKLVSGKGPVEFLIIAHAERPSEN